MKAFPSVIVLLVFLHVASSDAFRVVLPTTTRRRTSIRPRTLTRTPSTSAVDLELRLAAGKKNDSGDADAVTKASWYAVEAFGKVFGSPLRKGTSSASAEAPLTTDRPPNSLKETQRRIQQDNEREYFLSGEIDELIYDTDCTFADPFVSFQGRDRFVDNLARLGSFITKYSAKPLSYQVDEDSAAVTTKFMVKLQLNLPWKPVLAWPWGVRCEIDPDTYLVTLHEESWDIEPWEGVKQIFRKATVQV